MVLINLLGQLHYMNGKTSKISGRTTTLRLFVLTAFMVLLLACDRNIIGLYGHQMNRPGPNLSFIDLGSDSTVGYYTFSDITGSGQVCGRWRLKNDTVQLIADLRKAVIDTMQMIKLVEGGYGKDSVKVTIRDQNDSPVTGVSLRMNGNDPVVYTDVLGNATFAAMKVNTVEIGYLGFGKRVFEVNAGTNAYLITMNFALLPPLNLTELKLPLALIKKGRTLYLIVGDTLSKNDVFKKLKPRRSLL
ncbi:hypothetical protein DYU05_08010 [Mucilaginibacter terrenus]|uniref:Uncharacterized protein n=1 Tax=Mucilaginibacter terrenus TaxID=2482727 RepID=A0A3E2NX59_9SPHI|nr:hypothetical protein [Mucilaginibacter terrenus]RFZ85529.1 hypothetical protein DYU05_08010 [Mucilaginibacter terrenus]